MGETTTEPETTELLLEILRGAAMAHGLHEKELGGPDPDWPQWYAEFMTRTLGEAGYSITRASPK